MKSKSMNLKLWAFTFVLAIATAKLEAKCTSDWPNPGSVCGQQVGCNGNTTCYAKAGSFKIHAPKLCEELTDGQGRRKYTNGQVWASFLNHKFQGCF